MITLKQFDAFPPGEVFASGLTINSPFSGILVAENVMHEGLKWVAVKAPMTDTWYAYVGSDTQTFEYIRGSGIGLDIKNIKKLIQCEPEVYWRYWTQYNKNIGKIGTVKQNVQ